MTPEEIKALALEAGSTTSHWAAQGPLAGVFLADVQIERFAALVAAREREECAKLCDAVSNRATAAQGGALDSSGNVMLRQVAVLGSGACARAIRARGEQA